MGLYLFSGPAFEFPTHFGDGVSDSEGEALLDSLFCPNGQTAQTLGQFLSGRTASTETSNSTHATQADEVVEVALEPVACFALPARSLF